MAVEKEITFIVGCPRSGTTFLATLLREFFDIGFVNELQIIPIFYKKLKNYIPLTEKKNLDRLVSDIIKDNFFDIFRKTYSKYVGKPINITKEDILSLLPEKSYAGVIYSILENAAIKIGKTRVGSKNPDSYLDIINELFPRAKVIHIIRDGRDCALSFYRMHWGHTNAYMAAKTWKLHVSKNRYLGSSLLMDRYIELKYEDLLSNPISQLNRLANFLHLSVDWKNVEKLVESMTIKNNFYKWKKKMTQKDLKIFQAVAGDLLQECGYELAPVDPIQLTKFHEIYYNLMDKFLREFRYRFHKYLPT